MYTSNFLKWSVLNTFIRKQMPDNCLITRQPIPSLISWTAYSYSWRGFCELYWLLIWLSIHRLNAGKLLYWQKKTVIIFKLLSGIYHHHHHHYLPPWIRSLDLFRHRRVTIVSWYHDRKLKNLILVPLNIPLS